MSSFAHHSTWQRFPHGSHASCLWDDPHQWDFRVRVAALRPGTPEGLSKRFSSWMLSYMLKKQILEITSENFQTLHIYSYYTQRGSSKFIGSINIPNNTKGKYKISEFSVFSVFSPLWWFQETLCLRWKRLRLERRWGHGKALSAQPGNFVVSSCVYDLNQNRGQKHQKTCPKRTSSWQNLCKYERRHASLSIFCHHRKREPMKASIFGPPSQLSKNWPINTAILVLWNHLKRYNFEMWIKSSRHASEQVKMWDPFALTNGFQEVSRSIYILSSNHPSSFHSIFVNFLPKHFLVSEVIQLSHRKFIKPCSPERMDAKSSKKTCASQWASGFSKNNLPIQDVKEKLRGWRS